MILHVIVKPHKKFDKIEFINNEWHVSIKAKPQDNEANKYLIRYLSSVLNMPMSSIEIKRGRASRIKQIEINTDEKTVTSKLFSAAAEK